MTLIVRLLLAIAAPISAFFVGRDAQEFGVVQALIVMIFISIVAGWVAWIPHRKRERTKLT